MVDVSITDKTAKLSLALPLMTSNMDTVTGAEMANFIGEKGGIGVLHRFLSIQDNVRMFEACTYPTFVSILYRSTRVPTDSWFPKSLDAVPPVARFGCDQRKR